MGSMDLLSYMMPKALWSRPDSYAIRIRPTKFFEIDALGTHQAPHARFEHNLQRLTRTAVVAMYNVKEAAVDHKPQYFCRFRIHDAGEGSSKWVQYRDEAQANS